MKISQPNNKFALVIIWKNATLPSPTREELEAAYGRSLINSSGGIDRLRAIASYHPESYAKFQAIARANAASGKQLSEKEFNSLNLGVSFVRQ